LGPGHGGPGIIYGAPYVCSAAVIVYRAQKRGLLIRYAAALGLDFASDEPAEFLPHHVLGYHRGRQAERVRKPSRQPSVNRSGVVNQQVAVGQRVKTGAGPRLAHVGRKQQAFAGPGVADGVLYAVFFHVRLRHSAISVPRRRNSDVSRLTFMAWS